jgi:glycosyltransferase involved in cell wall biosynthesis
MLSVVILTKNEERDLPACLESVSWSDDIVVFDSISSDSTGAIAQAHGARVIARAFDNYAAQRNASLHQVAYANPWLLILDADERIPGELVTELRDFVRSAPKEVVAARLRRRDFLGKTWLRRSQLSPFFIRVVRPEAVRYEREINESLVVDGTIHELHGHFDHFPFSKGIAHWVSKHNLYSSMEATIVWRLRCGAPPVSLRDALFCKDFNQRRASQKQLFYRLPARPLVKFALIYFVRLGLLDGAAGLTYALLQSYYEYLIVLKTRELEQ